MVPTTGSESIGVRPPGLATARAIAVIRMKPEPDSGWLSMLVKATTAFFVRNWNAASRVFSVFPPIQPLTAWVRGESIVWMPSSSRA